MLFIGLLLVFAFEGLHYGLFGNMHIRQFCNGKMNNVIFYDGCNWCNVQCAIVKCTSLTEIWSISTFPSSVRKVPAHIVYLV